MPRATDFRNDLAALPHFRGLPPALLERVAELARLITLRRGEAVFRERQRCDGFYFVQRGLVKVFRLAPDGREQVVHLVGAGHSFAEAALFHFGVFPASAAAAATGTRVVRIDGPRFLKLLQAEPSLATSMLGSLSGWMHTLLDRIEVLTLISAGSRLSTYLLRLPATTVRGDLVVELPVAKRLLASELSITPETLSRQLARWRERGLIRVEGKRVVLLDTQTLEALADSSQPD